MSLPLIGDMNASFNIKNISFTVVELPGGVTRMQFGYIINNKAKTSDNYKSYNSMTFRDGIAESFSDAFQGGSSYSSLNTSSLGAPKWGINPVVGVYIDFGLSTLNEATDPQFEFMGGGVFLGATASYTVAWYALIPVVFIPCYFGVSGELSVMFSAGASASADSTLTFDSMDTTNYDLNKQFEFDAALVANATVQVYAGVGLCGTIGVRGGVQMNANYIYYPTAPTGYSTNGLGLTFSLNMRVDALLFAIPIPCYTFKDLNYGYFKEVTESKNGGASLLGAKGESLSTDNTEVRLKEFDDNPSEWLPAGLLKGGFSQSGKKILNENGYDRPDSQLLDLGNGQTLLVFLDTDTSKSDLEKTVLKYSVYSNGTWSDPIVIQDDGTADFQPNICDAGDAVIISWMSSDISTAKTGNPNQYLTTMEIYTTLLNKSTLQIGNIDRLTEDGYYDYEPNAIYDDATGDRAVYYIKSSAKDSFVSTVDSTSNDCVIVYMLYDAETGWQRDSYFDNEVASQEDAEILIANWKGQRFLSSPIDDSNLTDPLITDSMR